MKIRKRRFPHSARFLTILLSVATVFAPVQGSLAFADDDPSDGGDGGGSGGDGDGVDGVTDQVKQALSNVHLPASSGSGVFGTDDTYTEVQIDGQITWILPGAQIYPGETPDGGSEDGNCEGANCLVNVQTNPSLGSTTDAQTTLSPGDYDAKTQVVDQRLQAMQADNNTILSDGNLARTKYSPPLPTAQNPSGYPYNTPVTSDRGQKLAQAYQYRNVVNSSIKPGETHEQDKRDLVGVADASFRDADGAFSQGNTDGDQAGLVYLKFGMMALDVAISFSPAGWAKDTYEAVTGKSLVSGTKLDDFSRGAAIVGASVAVGIAVVGSGGLALGAAAMLPFISKILKEGKTLEDGEQAIAEATKLATYLEKTNIKVSEEMIEDLRDAVASIKKEGKLPERFITKSQAAELGWKPGTDLSEVAPGKSIGGDGYKNVSDPKLPSGSTYQEADLGYRSGRQRGPARLVWSHDFKFWISDHYKSFLDWN